MLLLTCCMKNQIGCVGIRHREWGFGIISGERNKRKSELENDRYLIGRDNLSLSGRIITRNKLSPTRVIPE